MPRLSLEAKKPLLLSVSSMSREAQVVSAVDEHPRRGRAEARLGALIVVLLAEGIGEIVRGPRAGDLEAGDVPVARAGGVVGRVGAAREAQDPALLVSGEMGGVAVGVGRAGDSVLAVKARPLALGPLDADDADRLALGAGAGEVDLLVVVAAVCCRSASGCRRCRRGSRLPRGRQ